VGLFKETPLRNKPLLLSLARKMNMQKTQRAGWRSEPHFRPTNPQRRWKGRNRPQNSSCKVSGGSIENLDRTAKSFLEYMNRYR